MPHAMCTMSYGRVHSMLCGRVCPSFVPPPLIPSCKLRGTQAYYYIQTRIGTNTSTAPCRPYGFHSLAHLPISIRVHLETSRAGHKRTNRKYTIEPRPRSPHRCVHTHTRPRESMSRIKEHKSITTLQRIIAYVADDHSLQILLVYLY